MTSVESKSQYDAAMESLRSGRYDQAVEGFTSALQSCGQKNQSMVLDARSAAYSKLGQSRLAAADAKRCIESNKGHYRGYVRSAEVFEQMRRFPQALSMLRHAEAIAGPQHQQDIRTRITVIERRLSLSDKPLSSIIGPLDPAAHLPLELMERIFELGVDSGQPEFALKPSHVSRLWRNVALSSPKAWKWYRFRFSAGKERSGYRKLGAWIARTSGAVYLETVEIGVPGEMNLAGGEAMLRTCMPYLRNLRIRTDHPAEVLSTLQNLHGSAKKLENIDVVARKVAVDAPSTQRFDWLDFGLLSASCHTLTTVTCAGIHLLPHSRLPIDLWSIRCIRIGAMALGRDAVSTTSPTRSEGHVADFLRKIACATYLRELDFQPLLGKGIQIAGLTHSERTIGTAEIIGGRAIEHPVVDFPHLETVAGLPLELLSRMDLPSVTSLAIDSRQTSHNHLTLHLAVKARIRLDMLVHLDCADAPRAEDQVGQQAGFLASRLSDMAALRSLIFRRAVDSTVIERLAATRDPVCPRLRSVTLVDGEITSTPIMRMVSHRQKADEGEKIVTAAKHPLMFAVPIEVLVLDNCQRLQLEAEQWLERNVSVFTVKRSKNERPSFRDARSLAT